MLDQLPSSSAGLGGALVLRVQTSRQQDGGEKIVRVAASRCAIGSDETCNLRVGGASAHPMHCLIVRGRDCVVVRRWAPDTLLNGLDFCDAILSPGDRLKAGEAEFEVLDVSADAGEPVAGDVLEIVDEPGASLQEVLLRRLEPDIRLRQARDINRARVRRLLAELRVARLKLQDAAGRYPPPDLDRDDDGEASDPLNADCDPAVDQSPVPEDEAVDIRFEPVSAEAPVSASALFGSRGIVSSPPDQDEDDRPEYARARETQDESQDAADIDEVRLQAPKKAAETVRSEESEESIEFLFARLLERVGQPREEVSYKANSDAPAPAKPSGAVKKAQAAIPEPERPALLTELPARPARSIDHKTDLSAMRELAHLNARSLLDVHFRRSFKRTTAGQATVALLALFAGVVLMQISSEAPIAFYLAIISFAVAIVWGAQNAVSLWQVAKAPAMKNVTGNDYSSAQATAVPASIPAPAATASPEAGAPHDDPLALQANDQTGAS